MASSKKGGGSKLSRSEVVTVRLDPRLRFGTELAARKQRRTVSSFIEWAIENALENYLVRDGNPFNDERVTVLNALDAVWDVDEPDRFAKLALHYPEMLTHEEQVLWKLVSENGYLWRGKYDENGNWTWFIVATDLNFERLREHWEVFAKVAEGELPKEKLPTWKQKGESASKNMDDGKTVEDEIPF